MPSLLTNEAFICQSGLLPANNIKLSGTSFSSSLDPNIIVSFPELLSASLCSATVDITVYPSNVADFISFSSDSTSLVPHAGENVLPHIVMSS